MKKGQKDFKIKLSILYFILPMAFYLIYFSNFHLIFFQLILQKPFILSLVPTWGITLLALISGKIINFRTTKSFREKILFYSIFITFIVIYFIFFPNHIPTIIAQTSEPTVCCGGMYGCETVPESQCPPSRRFYGATCLPYPVAGCCPSSQVCQNTCCSSGQICQNGQCVNPPQCPPNSDGCTPGSTQTQSCSYCSGTNFCTGGTQTRTCDPQCRWTSWSACSGGTCSCTAGQCGASCTPGSTETSPCGSGACAGTQTRTCVSCGTWGPWSACSSQGNVCSTGSCQPNSGNCGIGTQPVTKCDASGACNVASSQSCTVGCPSGYTCCSDNTCKTSCGGGGCTPSCGSWSNVACGSSPCASNQMKQIRSCTNTDCSTYIEERCVSDSCTAWQNQGCGLGGCPSSQMYQTRSCTYGCLPTSQCVSDPSCGGGFDFSVSVSPNSGTVYQGQSTSATVTTTLVSGSTQSVSFSCLNLPSGASCSFSPASCNPTCSSSLTISTSSSTPTGTYSITVRGTGGGITRSSTYTLTVAPSTCGNSKCDAGETQDNCPSDCKTVVIIYPLYTYPGQDVTLIVYFNDSRFNTQTSSYDVKVDLTIDGQVWSSADCPINSKRWRQDMSCNMGSSGMWGNQNWCNCQGGNCNGMHSGRSFNIRTSMGYGYIETTCRIPSGLAAGTHTLTAVPTIYSDPITLRAAQTEFSIGSEVFVIFNNFNNLLVRIFRQITGLFFFGA